MGYQTEDYTFGGLLNANAPDKTAAEAMINTLAYIVGLISSENNEIGGLKVANSVLVTVYDFEEQVQSALELIEMQRIYRLPTGYFPQTPVMLAREWSPISAMLDRGMVPVALNRETRRRACASGIWNITKAIPYNEANECRSDEDLFWNVLGKVVEKGTTDQFLVSVVAKPGWSYGKGLPLENLSPEEARKANRVIWQRKPIRLE